MLDGPGLNPAELLVLLSVAEVEAITLQRCSGRITKLSLLAGINARFHLPCMEG